MSAANDSALGEDPSLLSFLDSIKQGEKETAREFHWRLAEELQSNVSPEHRMMVYRHGLRLELRAYLENKDFDTEEDLVSVAESFEEGLARKFEAPESGHSNVKFVSFCFLAIVTGFTFFGIIIYLARGSVTPEGKYLITMNSTAFEINLIKYIDSKQKSKFRSH